MKKILSTILALFGVTGLPSKVEAEARTRQFVYVKIPEAIMPVERGAKYEDPLDAFLKEEKVGEVSGGGTQMTAPDNDGKRGIEYVGVDVDLSDYERGLPLLKSELIRLRVPEGTVLMYTRDDVKHSEPVK